MGQAQDKDIISREEIIRMTNDKKPIVEIKVTGFLPICPKDAEVLEYMTNIDAKHYEKLLGSKYKADEYAPVLLRIREACNLVLRKNKAVQEAAMDNIK